MTKAADIVGPITLTILVKQILYTFVKQYKENTDFQQLDIWFYYQASQVTNRDQFAVTQVTIDVMKKSRSPPRFERERYEGFIYSNSVPETMILRDRNTNRPFRVRARDEDFASVSAL